MVVLSLCVLFKLACCSERLEFAMMVKKCNKEFTFYSLKDEMFYTKKKFNIRQQYTYMKWMCVCISIYTYMVHVFSL